MRGNDIRTDTPGTVRTVDAIRVEYIGVVVEQNRVFDIKNGTTGVIRTTGAGAIPMCALNEGRLTSADTGANFIAGANVTKLAGSNYGGSFAAPSY